MLTDWVVAIVLLISLITDLKSRKILNIITYPSVFIGFTYYSFTQGFDGFLYSGEGFLLGLGLLLVPFLLNGMGAGDVKLLAAIGALKGPGFTFSAFLYICIAGGMIASILLLLKGELKQSLRRILLAIGFFQVSKESLQLLEHTAIHSKFPYAVPIMIGTAAAYLIGRVHGL